MEKFITFLKKLIEKHQIRINSDREEELLADFSKGYAEGWYFCVPIFFYEPLDIRFTYREKEKKKVWTQGATFKFSTGDVIWNHAYPYCENFASDGIKPKIGVQVQSSAPCLPKTKDRSERNPGKVNFTIFTESIDTDSKIKWRISGHYSLTQDDFIEFLIKGYSQSIDLDLTLEGFN